MMQYWNDEFGTHEQEITYRVTYAPHHDDDVFKAVQRDHLKVAVLKGVQIVLPPDELDLVELGQLVFLEGNDDRADHGVGEQAEQTEYQRQTEKIRFKRLKDLASAVV